MESSQATRNNKKSDYGMKKLITFIRNVFRHNISITAYADEYSQIAKTAKVHRFAKLTSTRLGEHSYIGVGSWTTCCDIGPYCSIGANTNVGLTPHTLDTISSSPIFQLKKNATGISWADKDYAPNILDTPRTRLEADVWIGSNAIVMSGVTLHTGCVVGAGAVVTKDVPPYAIVAGVPAKVLRYRFSPEIINRLMEIQWWKLSDEKITRIKDVFNIQNPTLEDLNKAFTQNEQQ